MLKITGYPDRYSAAAGEVIDFKVSLEEGTCFDARLVRVVHGDANPQGPGLKFIHIPSNADGSHPGRVQTTDAGSYAVIDHVPALAENFTYFAMIWPTLLRHDDQTLIAQWDCFEQNGFHIGLSKGGFLTVTLGGAGGVARAVAAKPVLERQWYSIAVAIEPKVGTVTIEQRPLVPYAHIDDSVSETFALKGMTSVALPIYMAGCPLDAHVVARHYDGKIDGPLLISGKEPITSHQTLLSQPQARHLRNRIIAQWDFSQEIESANIIDIGPYHLDGRIENLPARAMKGWNWTGEEHDWKRKREHYGAIHFHRDDLYDAKWETSLRLQLPENLKSGPYALHICSGESTLDATREDYISFFVCPSRGLPRGDASGSKRSKIAFLAPTCSYMAYANHGEHITARGVEVLMNRMVHFGHSDLYMYDHPEIGGSLYDTHEDGSGVCYSSRLRPVLNFKAQYHSWLGGHGSAVYQYNADTHLFDWLEHQAVDYDVITDEDLHEGGFELIEDYRIIITGTHPEYHSTRMWDAMKDWIDRGGRLMYMGGDGWYWRVAFSPVWPGAIELRRAEDGIRPWIAEPGEYYHSFTGEYGGLWRRLGRAPNVMAGVGFIAQGFDFSSYYRRAPDSYNPRAAFIFDGVEGDIIGDFGLVGGGAAGIELDCIATDLGSPPNMLRLASSEGHSGMMLLVNEEFGPVPPNLGGDQNMRVRADLAFGETPSGGALFATSSIAWCGALSHNHYNNNVSRITQNVLRRFMDPTPFPTGGEAC